MGQDGGCDGATQALTAWREAAPSRLLQESPGEDLGAAREEEGAEPAVIRRGAGVLTAEAPVSRTVAELLQFLLGKGRKSPVTLSGMVKCVTGDLKELFPQSVSAGCLWFELKRLQAPLLDPDQKPRTSAGGRGGRRMWEEMAPGWFS